VVMVVNVRDRDRQLDLLEEASLNVEDEPVLAGLETFRKLRDAAVVVGLLERDEVLAAKEPDLHAGCRLTELGVEDVGRDHWTNLLAWSRWCRAISSSSARTRRPSRTTSSPST
jgi:hypothetical protein